MAFVTIPASSIDVGDPLTSDTMNLIKNNEDDLNTRLTSLESGASKIVVLNETVLLGSLATTATGIHFYTAIQDFTITNCKIRIFEKSPITGGILEIDVKVNTTQSDTGMASIFTTKPSINFATASDHDFSTNAVFDNSKINMVTDSVLRFDITSLPSTGGNLGKFQIILFGEVS